MAMKRPQGFDPSARAKRSTAAQPRPSRQDPPKKARVVREEAAQHHDKQQHDSRQRAGEPDAITAPIPLPGIVQAASATPASSKSAESLPDPEDETSKGAGARSARARLRGARRERKRFERGEVRRFTRRARHRRILWISAAGILAALVLGVLLVSFSPLMALRTIEVQGASKVDAAAVKKALNSQLGRPLPLIDSGAITSELAAFPLIRSFSTEVHPPSTLLVRIVERAPVGVLKTGSKYTVVDPAGVVISTFPDRPAGYPLITPAAGSAGFTAVAAVLQSLPATVLSKVNTATATTADDVSFTLLSTGAKVVWGSADQSSLKAAVLADLLVKAPGARTYDLSSPHNAVTR